MIQSDIELLAKQLLTPLHALKLDAEYHENGFAVSQSKLALDLVESTLLLHRFDAHQSQLELEPLHIGDTINKVLMSLREYFTEQGVDYDVDFQKGTPSVYADRLVIEHAVKMFLYASHMYNTHGSVLRMRTYKDNKGNVKLSLVARELENERVVLHTKSEKISRQAPIDVSRSLFELVGGHVHKTHTADSKGFSVTLPATRQLQLI